MSRKARVTYSYEAAQEDEISLEVGDIITNVLDKDVGWCEGEVRGKRGMFPNNFVEDYISDGEEAVAPKSDSVGGKKAKVMFQYKAENEDELSLEVDEIVDILDEEEEGWWKGRVHDKIGVFPSNFVEVIENVVQTRDKHEELSEEPPQHSKRVLNVSNEVDGADGEQKRHSGIKGGVGFGGLIDPTMLTKKLKKVDRKEEKIEKTATEVEKTTKGPKSAKTRPAPPVPVAPQAKKSLEHAKVTSDYDPQDRDELRLRVGDVICVINKEVADNDGWWEGELNGKVGMFPNNFVELVNIEEDGPSKDKPPDLPTSSKRGVPVLPLANEVPKPPITQEKRVPSHPPEEKKEPLAPPEVHPLQGMKKPPVKREKPSLPPKKPAIPGKKPEPVKKHEEEKTKRTTKLDEKESSTMKTKVNDDSKESDELRVRESSHLRKKSKEEEVTPHAASTKPAPEVRTEDVGEGDLSFDDIPETQTLNHLTANRAKHPQKRPPSKNADLLSPEPHKQPPGRPKEAPKELVWKREAREARENKVPPPIMSKDEAVEKRKSLIIRDEEPVSHKAEPVSVPSADVEKLSKEVSELREMVTRMEKKQNEAVKKLEEKFNREIEALTNDFDEERKQNAALKVEIDRIKRRQARLDGPESK